MGCRDFGHLLQQIRGLELNKGRKKKVREILGLGVREYLRALKKEKDLYKRYWASRKLAATKYDFGKVTNRMIEEAHLRRFLTVTLKGTGVLTELR